MKIIVGLGNPGKTYEKTYHNAGFMAIDKLANKLGASFMAKPKLCSQIAQVNYGGEKVVLVKPETFMNLSGQAVVKVLNFFKASLADMLVIYDDLDIDVGLIRFRTNGSSGTHNGMRNIIALLGSGEFARARIGIKKDNPQIPTIDYVLMKISAEREDLLSKATDNAAELSIDFIRGESGEKIMCTYNGK